MVARVVVLGAGYAGVSAVRRLSRTPRMQVTLVNPRAEFVERIRLHQLVAGNHRAVLPLRDVVPSHVQLETACAASIDAPAQMLLLDSGKELPYDYLIFAIGSRSRPSDIHGADTHAHTVDTLENAVAATHRLQALEPGAAVTVVGGGLTGIETAAELAANKQISVRLITRGNVGPSVGRKARQHLRRFFAAHEVELVEHDAVDRITATSVVLSGGRSMTSDLTIATTSYEAPNLARTSGLTVDDAGALIVDESLVSIDHTSIVGAGDASVFTANPIRMSCQAAIPLGVHAAETVLHLVAGETPKPVARKFVGQCVSLGRRDAVFQLTNRADEPRPSLVVTGRAGAVVKEQICASTISFGTVGKFSYGWNG